MAFSRTSLGTTTTVGTTTPTVTVTAPSLNQLLIASIGASKVGQTATVPTDNGDGSNPWKFIGTLQQSSGAAPFTAAFYKVPTPTDVSNLTTTQFNMGATSTVGGAWVEEFSGFLGTPTLDLKGQIGVGSGATSAQPSDSATGAALTELDWMCVGTVGLGTLGTWTFSPDGGSTTYTLATNNNAARIYTGWGTSTTTGTTAQWHAAWSTGGAAAAIGATFYDLVPTSNGNFLILL